jgi:hypothetical protein
MNADDIGSAYIHDLIAQFAFLKRLADKAIARLTDQELFRTIDRESNSVGVIMKHVGGNLRSRWLEFLTSDGEKPDRNRDDEFEPAPSRAQVQDIWERGWKILLDELSRLTPPDLTSPVYIRSEPHSVIKAANRSLQHTAYHVGQIVFLAKHLKAGAWESLSIPKGRSEEFNRRMSSGSEPRAPTKA